MSIEHLSSGSAAHLVLNAGLARVNSLSRREREVFQLLGSAPKMGDVAEELHIALRTVKFHVENIRTKLGGLTYMQVCVTACLYQLRYTTPGEPLCGFGGKASAATRMNSTAASSGPAASPGE